MSETFKIGCHLSSSGGYAKMAKQIIAMGGNTFQFFTRNPQGGKASALRDEDIAEFLEISKDNIPCILAHAPYTMNPASADPRIHDFTVMAMSDDMARLERTPGNMYNFHPGSHVGQGIDKGIENISAVLNEIIKPDQSTTVLLETMAGKGSEVGSRFEELRRIIDAVKCTDKIGVCLDTCHVYDAGYDIVSNLDGVINEFDNIVGLEKLRAVHINDSKNPFSSHKDRHECIGKGHLGFDAFTRIINHPKLRHLPFYLETPNDIAGYAAEIEMLKEARK